MTSSVAEPAVTRKSVPLTERDLRDLERLRQPGTSLSHALREILGAEPSLTEAGLLHLLLRLGIDVVAERAREEGYRQLAEMTTEEEHEELRALSARFAETRADEE